MIVSSEFVFLRQCWNHCVWIHCEQDRSKLIEIGIFPVNDMFVRIAMNFSLDLPFYDCVSDHHLLFLLDFKLLNDDGYWLEI